MNITFKQRLSKEVAQLVFRPTIPSASSFLSVVKDYEDLFNEWGAIKDDCYGLYSLDSLEVMTFNSRAISYISESHTQASKTNNHIVKNVAEAFAKYRKQFDIKEVRRIGYGAVKILETEIKFEELCELISKKLHSSNKSLLSILLEGKPRDVGFRVDGQKNNFKNHFAINSANSQKSTVLFNSSFAQLERDFKLSDNNLHLEIDVFTDSGENIEIQSVDSTLLSAQKEAYRLLNQIEDCISK